MVSIKSLVLSTALLVAGASAAAVEKRGGGWGTATCKCTLFVVTFRSSFYHVQTTTKMVTRALAATTLQTLTTSSL